MGARTSEQAQRTFPFPLRGSLECEQPREAGGIWWREALVRPEASSASDLLWDSESLLLSSLGLNFPICSVGGASFPCT